MLSSRQVWRKVAIADVVLFLIAVAFNGHSNTSLDGIVWWLALALFCLMILAAFAIAVQYVITRLRRPRRARQPRRARRAR